MSETVPNPANEGIEQLRSPLEFLKGTGLYDWLSTWPDWLLYVVVLGVFLVGPAIKKSYRDFMAKKLSAGWSRLRRLSPKSIIAAVREKRRVHRIRRRGRLEASDRRSRAMEILPYLDGPNAERRLRRHSVRPSDEFLETLRIGSSSSLRMRPGDEQRYHRIKDAELQSNPIIEDGCALWILDDTSVIVAKPDGTLEVGTKEHVKAAQEGFFRSMKKLLGEPS